MSKIAIIGAGNQALSWALNLRDSNGEFSVFLRENSQSCSKIRELGLPLESIGQKLQHYNYLCLLIPDSEHEQFLTHNKEFISKESKIIYAHGFSISQFGLKEKFPEFEHLLLAPKSIGVEIREKYLLGKLTPAVYSDKKEDLLILSQLLKFNLIEQVAIEQEVKADLFSEQALLCGLLPTIIRLSFDTMRKNGLPPKTSFLETWHESLLILNVLINKGPVAFFSMISPNALMGAIYAQEKLPFKELEQSFERIFSGLENQEFNQYIESFGNSKKADFLRQWEESEINEVFKTLQKDLYL